MNTRLDGHNMSFAEKLEKALSELKNKPLVPYAKAAKQFGEDEGVYVLWASPKLVSSLKGKKLKIHAARALNGEVELQMTTAFNVACNRPNGERCYYVGKTCNFKKRHAIRRHTKLEEILGPAWSQKKIKEHLQYSFISVKDWKLRFFLECGAIAAFLPVLNTQPER
jgi:hypothetical protein